MKTKAISRNFYILYTLAHLKQKANVRGTWLGYLWWFIEPLILITIYCYLVGIIFGHADEDRVLMIAIGVTTWKWFNMSLRSATTSFLRYKGIVCQVKMPIAILPISAVCGETYLFMFAYGLLQIAFLFLGYQPDMLALVLTFLVSFITVASISLALAMVNVYIRDTSILIGFGLRLMFYITPIIYPPHRVPEEYSFLITYNPFAHLIGYFDDALVHIDNVNYHNMLISLLMSTIVFFVLLSLCRKLTANIVRNV